MDQDELTSKDDVTVDVSRTITETSVLLSSNIGIKYVFSCINDYQIPREMLKTKSERPRFSTYPKETISVFNIFLWTWHTLMYWKIMFDR